ncbi:MAG: Gfo/Idh/MocA family oxidoreductase [Litorimonas sp.]
MGGCRVGVLGAGSISERYIRGLQQHQGIRVAAVAGHGSVRARRIGERRGVAAFDAEAFFYMAREGAYDLVLNLTPAAQHCRSTERLLRAGCHVYSEKPLAPDRRTAGRLVELARTSGLRLGCGPAIALGRPWQALADDIRSRRFGRFLGGHSSLAYAGPELFHHSPDHLYGPGAGPLWDMGIYHVALVSHLFGPIASVFARSSRLHPTRTIAKGPQSGRVFGVETDTDVAGIFALASGPSITFHYSFDTRATASPGLELRFETATVRVGRPETFAPSLSLARSPGDWAPLYPDLSTGPVPDDIWAGGAVLTATARDASDLGPVSAEHAYHHVCVLESVDISARSGQPVSLGAG